VTSIPQSTSSTTSSASSVVNEILALPKPQPLVDKRKGRPGLTTHATCISDDEFLQKLRENEQEKKDKEEKVERQRKRLDKTKLSEKKHQTKKAEVASENDGSDQSEGSEGSTCQCPVCGLVYGEEDTLWICSDGCDCWYDLKCMSLGKRNPCIPEYYWCENCSRVSEVCIATCACTSCTCPHIYMCCQLVLSQVDMSLHTCTVSWSS